MTARGRLALVVAVLSTGAAAHTIRGEGTPRELVVCYPGMPGSPKAAENTMEALAGYLGKEAGLELRARYLNDDAMATRHVTATPPSFGILSLDVYLRWKERHGLSLLAMSERRGATREQFHALVPRASRRNELRDLRGATVASSFLEDLRFASRVVFASGVDASKDIALVNTRTMVKSMKLCSRGERISDGRVLDAIVIDDYEVEGMGPTREFRQLREVWSSRPLPTPPVVAWGDAPPDEAKRLAAALLRMAEADAGRTVLREIQATGFKPPDVAAYAEVERDYGR